MQSRRPFYRRTEAVFGFTVLELIVSFGIMCVLLAVLLPAVMSARELSRRTQCTNHFKQLGVAVQQYHDVHRVLPLAWIKEGENSRMAKSWAVSLLPHVERQEVAEAVVARQASLLFDSYDEAAAWQLAIFTCPSDIAEPAFELLYLSPPSGIALDSRTSFSNRNTSFLPTANYVAVYGTVEADEFEEQSQISGTTFGDGPIIHERGVKLVELAQGTSHTLLIGERMMATVPSTWLGVDLDGEDAGCRIAGSAISRPNCETCDECEFSSRHPGGSMFLWADGHVSLVDENIDTVLYQRSAKRRGE